MNEERLYINGNEIILPIGQAIAKTFQVNNIGNLADRQSNFTRTINLPKHPNNVKALDYLGVIGNDSNIPYQINRIDYFVGNECLIYKGWGNISESNDNYNLNIYDGIVDFYKAIENKFITDADISGLNHYKNIDSVINTWTGNTPYQYIIADYNGKMSYNITGSTGIVESVLNIDYLIPSANVKYIWDRIFEKFGFTYEGNIFNTEVFKNLWLSYPKENSTLVPNKLLLNQQGFVPHQYTYTTYSGYAQLNGTQWFAWLFNTPFTTTYAKVLAAGSTTTSFGDIIPNPNHIEILQNGTYVVDLSGITTSATVSYFLRRNNVLFDNGVLEPNSDNSELTKQFNCLVGDTISFILTNPIANFPFTQKISKVDGYQVNFEEAFINFKISDFINEVLQRFSLTMFPYKYENKLAFLTTAEWLETSQLIDWSNKNPVLVNTVYSIGDYCQKNRFKYKYNDDNAIHNDGIILIDNPNLDDEKILIESAIFSPEVKQEVLFNFNSNVYKFWNKEIKDNGTINYKSLENRFYLLRSNDYTFNTPIKIGSELFSNYQTISNCKKESYSRLSFQDIITDYYQPIKSILNKSKLFQVDLNLTIKDVNDFDFRKLIYIDQFGSYFLVNKISNYVQNKLTRCELIKVDYKGVLTPIIPELPINTATYLTINSVVYSGCKVTLNYSTDATIGTPIDLVAQPNNFGIPVFTTPDPLYYYSTVTTNTGITNTISFNVEAGSFYQVQLSIAAGNVLTPIYSNTSYFENTTGCIVSSPSQLTITSVTLLSAATLSNTYKINFTTNAVLPRTVYVSDYKTPVLIDPSNPYAGSFGGWESYTSVTAPTNSINTDISTLFGTPLKIRIKIGNTVSNEYTI